MNNSQPPEGAAPAEARDYRETLRLPQTDFPMKAGLPAREPDILAHWQKLDLYARLREQSAEREKFILHDGPPYANGEIHIGHALNKLLKDMSVRAQQMMGKNAIYVPGWDCHGLPIEWKIEEQYRQQGKDKDDVPRQEFRAECRRFAEKWIDVQRQQFKRLGVIGDWQHPYSTMDFDAEAAIVSEFQKFVMNGSLYRGSKPVMWSVVEKTALAEAEVEYEEYQSTTLFVKFPVKHGTLAGAALVIWTTTPWTLPANRAIAFSPKLAYGLYEADGERLVLCDALAERVFAIAEYADVKRLGDADLTSDVVCRHPLYEAHEGYGFDVPVHAGDFVTDEAGTGLVHIAPGHGQDDFEFGLAHNIEVPFTIDEAGVYLPHVALFHGKRVYTPEGKRGDANGAVIEALEAAGAVLAQGKLRHQYPHSWRSKAPLIFRNTPQWFVSMAHDDLRTRALAAIEEVEFFPAQGRNRIKSMVATRPDWVVSRQRAWGVPLTLFVHKTSGDILRDDAVNGRIVAAVRARGADAWFDTDAQDFLGADYAAQDYEQVSDILDVWFDSGVTHAFVLEARDDLHSPADVYLEGSDQHRGWFQSSLLTACATRGRAPYKQIVTHGFTLDDKGRKMAKSGKNAVDPQKIIQQAGAEIIRLWVASSDYREDTRIGADIIKANTDSYRKMRNCFRFLLGNLHGFDASDKAQKKQSEIAVADMPELERYILHRLTVLDGVVREAYNQYDFRKVYQSLFNFMTVDLSAFYFDIRKDALYCDSPSDATRRASRAVLDILFQCLTTWAAPILAFTCEEVWQSRYGVQDDSVHLQTFPTIDPAWHDEALAQKWTQLRHIRRVVTGALEICRRDKIIGSSLEAAPIVYITNAPLHAHTHGQNMADLCITSQIELRTDAPPPEAFALDDVAGVAVMFAPAQGKKCRRSWKFSDDVGSDAAYPDLSARDAAVVRHYDGERH